jgi:hypothetical protein
VRQIRAEPVFSAALAKAGIDACGTANRPGSALPAKHGADTDTVSRKRKPAVHSLRCACVARMRRELPASAAMRMAGHINGGQTGCRTDRGAADETPAAIAGAGQAANHLFSQASRPSGIKKRELKTCGNARFLFSDGCCGPHVFNSRPIFTA